MGFDDDAAHHMALLAMEQYGCALAALNKRFTPARVDGPASAARSRAGSVPVWLPTEWC